MIIKRVLIFSLLILLLSGTLYTTYNWREWQPYLLGISLSLIIFLYVVKGRFRLITNAYLFLTYIFFLMSAFFSAWVIKDIELLFGALLIFAIYFCLTVLLPNIWRENYYELIIYSFLIGHLPILFIPVIMNGFEVTSYSGVFYNPNSLGATAATTFAVLLSVVGTAVDDYFLGSTLKHNLFFVIFLLVAVWFLVVFSSSRTSFLTAMVLLLFFIAFMIKSLIKTTLKNKTKGLRLVVIFSVIILIMLVNSYARNSIIEKFLVKSQDVFDGRMNVWKTVINNAKLFGHGRSYFSEIGLGAHNTFISILGQLGIVPLLFYVAAVFQKLYISIKYMSKGCIKYRHLPFYAVLGFVLLSMGEGMMFKNSMLLMYCTIGFSTKN